MTIGLRPGYEWHLPGTEKLSPYLGAEAIFSLTTNKVEADTAVPNKTSTNTTGDAYKVLTMVQTGKGAGTTFGLNLIAGVDFYFAKNLSLGAELGFGFTTTSLKDIESQTAGEATSLDQTIVLKDNPLQAQGSSFVLTPNTISRIKLGWLF
jgi:opacity protein-like surface antigen